MGCIFSSDSGQLVLTHIAPQWMHQLTILSMGMGCIFSCGSWHPALTHIAPQSTVFWCSPLIFIFVWSFFLGHFAPPTMTFILPSHLPTLLTYLPCEPTYWPHLSINSQTPYLPTLPSQPQWTSTHQCTIHWMLVIMQVWMNLNWVNIWFHLGNQFCKK
jgi:hypothetical protein